MILKPVQPLGPKPGSSPRDAIGPAVRASGDIDVLYPVGRHDPETLRRLAADLPLPINAIALPHQDDPAARAILDALVAQYLQKLDPVLVAPLAAFLTHRDCPVSGEIYTVGAGHVARFFIGRTKGFYSPALSVEDVRDHLDEIHHDTDYTVPGSPADEMSTLFATIMANQPD